VKSKLVLQEEELLTLGIAESFVNGVSEKSILAGIVMKTDMAIEDFIIAKVTVGGMDATEQIVRMYHDLHRDDIDLLMLNGCVISWYNVIDLHRVAEETSLPLICATYEASEGLEKYFIELFPEDWEVRVGVYHKNKSRNPIELDTGYKVYIRCIGMTVNTAKEIMNRYTWQGSIAEPLRVARLIARSIVQTS
jgi:endonuclease V-like protein UPF0215 family